MQCQATTSGRKEDSSQHFLESIYTPQLWRAGGLHPKKLRCPRRVFVLEVLPGDEVDDDAYFYGDGSAGDEQQQFKQQPHSRVRHPLNDGSEEVGFNPLARRRSCISGSAPRTQDSIVLSEPLHWQDEVLLSIASCPRRRRSIAQRKSRSVASLRRQASRFRQEELRPAEDVSTSQPRLHHSSAVQPGRATELAPALQTIASSLPKEPECVFDAALAPSCKPYVVEADSKAATTQVHQLPSPVSSSNSSQQLFHASGSVSEASSLGCMEQSKTVASGKAAPWSPNSPLCAVEGVL